MNQFLIVLITLGIRFVQLLPRIGLDLYLEDDPSTGNKVDGATLYRTVTTCSTLSSFDTKSLLHAPTSETATGLGMLPTSIDPSFAVSDGLVGCSPRRNGAPSSEAFVVLWIHSMMSTMSSSLQSIGTESLLPDSSSLDPVNGSDVSGGAVAWLVEGLVRVRD